MSSSTHTVFVEKRLRIEALLTEALAIADGSERVAAAYIDMALACLHDVEAAD